MYCKHCGAKVEDTQRFCSSCGRPIDTPPPHQNSGSPPPPPPVGLNQGQLQTLFRVATTVMAIYFAVQALEWLVLLPNYIRTLFHWAPLMSVSIVSVVLLIAANAVTAVCYGLLGWRRKNTATLLVGLGIGLLLAVAATFVTTVQMLLMGGGFHVTFAFSRYLVAGIITCLLLRAMGELPGTQTAEQVKEDFKKGYADFKETTDRFTGAASQNTYTTYGGGMTMPLRTDRNIVLYVIFSIITCGIYHYYTIYTLARDMNIIAREDGQTTPGLLMFIVLSFITCGLYSIYWLYCLANRQSMIAPRYGLNIQENGTTILLWYLIGFFVCGIGPIVSMYFVFRNMNALCAEYNRGYTVY